MQVTKIYSINNKNNFIDKNFSFSSSKHAISDKTKDGKIERVKIAAENCQRQSLFSLFKRPKYKVLNDENLDLAYKIFADTKCRNVPYLQKNAWQILKNTDSLSAEYKKRMLNKLVSDNRFFDDKQFAKFAVDMLCDVENKTQLDAAMKMLNSNAYSQKDKRIPKIAKSVMMTAKSFKSIQSVYHDNLKVRDEGYKIVEKAFSDKRIYENLDLMKKVFIDYCPKRYIFDSYSVLSTSLMMDSAVRLQK